jgi:Cytochrome P460
MQPPGRLLGPGPQAALGGARPPRQDDVRGLHEQRSEVLVAALGDHPQGLRHAGQEHGRTIPFSDIRFVGQTADDLAIKAFREGKLPFPDGAIIAALHWNEESSDADNQALEAGFPGLGLETSFAGSPVNVQFMVKDSKKYAASGGWGYADFTHGKPGNEALHEKCYPCHQPAKDRDYVFTRYAPTP